MSDIQITHTPCELAKVLIFCTVLALLAYGIGSLIWTVLFP